MKKKGTCLITGLILSALFCWGKVYADETPDVGGQVTSNGKITFYEEEKEESSPKIDSIKKNLPKTGENKDSVSFVLTGFVLVGCAYFFFQIKEKADEK